MLWWISAAIGARYSFCNQKDFYPWPFILNLGVFAALFLFVHLKTKQGFKLQWAKEEEVARKLFEA